MAILPVILTFAVLVVLASSLTLWRRADKWDGVPIPRRFLLAVAVSWKWWLAYSFGLLFFEITWLGNVRGGVIVVITAIVMALLFGVLRAAELRKSRGNGRD